MTLAKLFTIGSTMYVGGVIGARLGRKLCERRI